MEHMWMRQGSDRHLDYDPTKYEVDIKYGFLTLSARSIRCLSPARGDLGLVALLCGPCDAEPIVVEAEAFSFSGESRLPRIGGGGYKQDSEVDIQSLARRY